jgi:hypothetical protein
MSESDTTFETDTSGNVKTEAPTNIDGSNPPSGVPDGTGGWDFSWEGGSDGSGSSGSDGKNPIEVDPSEKAPSTGKNPSKEGEPLTGEAGDGLNGSGGSGGGSNQGGSRGPRVDEGGSGPQSGTPGRTKRTYKNIGELRDEVEKERRNIKEIAGNLTKKCKERQDALQGEINRAGEKHNKLAQGVFDKLPPIPGPGVGSGTGGGTGGGGTGGTGTGGTGTGPRTPPNAPLGPRVKRSYAHFQFTKANAPPESKPLVEVAEKTLEKADQLCEAGDLENGKKALDTVDALTEAALNPQQQPSPPGRPPDPGTDSKTQQRSNAQNTSLGLCEAANELDSAGFSNLAGSLRVTAGDLLNFGLGQARSNKLIGLPFNILEGFVGKTIEFDDAGDVIIRDATTIETIVALAEIIIFVAGTLATGGGGIAGAAARIVGASIISKLGKENAEKLAKLAGQIKDKIRRGESFDIPEFPGYPEGVSKPSGPFKYRTQAETEAARNLARRANDKFRKDNPSLPENTEIHHIHPLKWGGDPSDPANLEPLLDTTHTEVTNWWNALQRLIKSSN